MKARLNHAFASLHGSTDTWSYKGRGTDGRQIISAKPDMSRVKWSPAQKAHRHLVTMSRYFYRALKARPDLEAHYRTLAQQAKLTTPAYVMKVYLAAAKEGRRLEDQLRTALPSRNVRANASDAPRAGR